VIREVEIKMRVIPFYKAILLLFLFTLLAGFALANNYSLDYLVFGMDGKVSATANYSFNDLLNASGLDNAVQNSTNYSCIPVFGLSEEPPTVIYDWYLY
jgi:hypothetical protein